MKPLHISEILASIDHVAFHGNNDHVITEVIQLGETPVSSKQVCWCSDKNIDLLTHHNDGTFITSELGKNKLLQNNAFKGNIIVSTVPRRSFSELLNLIVEQDQTTPKIANSAVIEENAVIGKDASIGHHVVIEAGVEIGDHVRIGHHTVIHKNTKIGSNTMIGTNCSIGGVGFGYENNENGEPIQIPHLGNVVIGNYVEIGSNVCIDKAVLGSTFIDDQVKIDNLVHIAHGVKIGKRSLIIANSMVAGSAVIENDVWVAPSVSIMQKRTIKEKSTIGMGSVVLKDVNPEDTVVGVPAKSISKK